MEIANKHLRCENKDLATTYKYVLLCIECDIGVLRLRVAFNMVVDERSEYAEQKPIFVRGEK